MILGSHNTMTYLKPTKWWMYLFRFMSKCQKLTIEEQYNKGVRWFDFRLSFRKNKKGLYDAVFTHGYITYKQDPEEIFKWLNTKKDAQCRIVLEKKDHTQEYFFNLYVNRLIDLYPNLQITQIAKKDEWEDLIAPTADISYPLVHKYASNNTNNPKWYKYKLLKSKAWSGLMIDDLWPWIYARFNNKYHIRKYEDSDVCLILDFVN